MSAAHTPGRLRLTAANALGLEGNPQAGDRLKIHSPWIEDAWDGDEEADANMRRLAACWNACEGLSTEALENITMVGDTLASRFNAIEQAEAELISQRYELRALLREGRNDLVIAASSWNEDENPEVANFHRERVLDLIKRVDAAITRATEP